MVFNRLIPSEELSSEAYHGTKNTFSSSQLKTILQDPEVFYKKYVTKEIAREENSAFDLGSYFHTALLEPEKLSSEASVYTGLARRGKEWEEFKEKNKGKSIITASEKSTADRMIKSVQDSPISMSFLNSSRPEVSAFVEFFVLGSDIFAFNESGCHCLTASGWVCTSLDFDEEDIKEFGTKLVIKVRADALGIDNGVISDLKSTTGNVKNSFDMASKVSSYEYDLSAALYLDVFTLATGTNYDTFVWIFSSKDKDSPGAMSWKASENNILVGRSKVRKAIKLLARYVSNGWTFEDQLGTLEPPRYALDWLSIED